LIKFMSFLSNLFGDIAGWIINIIGIFGYPGIVFLMVIDSMPTPVPSELIMPFAGYLVSQGKFNFFMVVTAGAIGSLIGSLIFYYVGLHGGRRFVKHFGKWFFLDQQDLDDAESYFKRKGEKMIFISRFVPIVRSVISIPAGMAKMHIKKFMIYTFFGAWIWSFILTLAGYLLGKNWDKVNVYSDQISLVVLIVGIIVLIHFIRRHIIKKKNRTVIP